MEKLRSKGMECPYTETLSAPSAWKKLSRTPAGLFCICAPAWAVLLRTKNHFAEAREALL
jgi:hypothetical protein